MKRGRGHIRFQVLAGSAGFTLFEVLVAVAIISVALVAVYRMQAQTISMNYAARFHAVAPFLAQSKLSEFEILPQDELSDDAGDFGDDFPGFQWQVTVEDVEDTENELLGEVVERLKCISVEVSSENSGFIYGFRTYRLVEGEK